MAAVGWEPRSGYGLGAATGRGGRDVQRAGPRRAGRVRQGGQIGTRMLDFAGAPLAECWAGPYDITQDWNPVLGSAG
ncbi:hypothetical protein [Candidatus Palauibacter sp.]|uniref:hypothetical protein n=1 Tax=Candidatus Palauibacter sp. TaxID=3101350 RepID=UPI003CC69A22